MNMNKKEDLIEQYEDAAFALMMSEYAEQEGNRLLQEFEEAKARGEVPPVPADLDQKCRELIRKAYEKERGKERIKKFVCFAGKTAAIWFVAIGICSTLVLSVEALRTPVINFIVEQHEKFTTIHIGKDPSLTPSTQPKTDSSTKTQSGTPLDGMLPDGYNALQYNVRDDGSFVAFYENINCDYIMLSSTIGNGRMNLDTEDATISTIVILGHPGYLVEKGQELTISWYQENNNTSYQLRSTHILFADLWMIAEKYIMTANGG